MKLRAAGQRGVIVHPEHPEIRVTVEKPPVKDIIAWEDVMEKYTERKIAVHPDTGKVIKVGQSVAMMPTRANIPFDVTLDTMVKYVKNVEGFEDVPFSEDPALAKEFLREFLDSRFSWKAEEEVPELDDDGEPLKDADGKPKTKKKEMSHNFYHYVIRKIFDQETYGDPLESSSESTATGDTA